MCNIPLSEHLITELLRLFHTVDWDLNDVLNMWLSLEYAVQQCADLPTWELSAPYCHLEYYCIDTKAPFVNSAFYNINQLELMRKILSNTEKLFNI
jgi:hypothetical protein